MRLLHLIQRYYPFQGGSERYFQSLGEHLAADGAQVDVYTTDAWDLEYFWDPRARRVAEPSGAHNGVRITRLPVRHLPLPRLSHRAIRRLMAESARWRFPGQPVLLRGAGRFGPWVPGMAAALAASGERADLVHSANVAFESLIAAGARHARRVDAAHVVTPFVHLGEGPASKVRRYYTMPHQIALLREADAVMTLTSIEAAALAALGVPEPRLHVVGAGIDVAAATGGDARRARERLGYDGPLVLSLGAAAFDKGTVHLARAVADLARDGVDVRLAVAGPILSEFRRFADALDAADRACLHLLGFVSEEEKRDLLAAADMVALPSRTESFGLIFPEAWANGKPVIGARAGAIPAVVRDQEDGLLVPFGDVPALADAIRTLVERPALASRLATAGRAKVVDEATWYGRVRTVYEQVLGQPVATARSEPVGRGHGAV